MHNTEMRALSSSPDPGNDPKIVKVQLGVYGWSSPTGAGLDSDKACMEVHGTKSLL